LYGILFLVLVSGFPDAGTASSFFDEKVLLTQKADPGLRSFLGLGQPDARGPISVMVIFAAVPLQHELRVLESLGSIRTFTGHVATMDLPVGALSQLASLSFVDRIASPRVVASQLDVSVPEISADQVWENVFDEDGRRVNGAGVVVGIVDSGIDYLHDDFYFENGTSKILYIWDQSVEGKHPHGFQYGNECDQLDIRIKACSEFDGGSQGLETGHGTAVAAVAASSGLATSFIETCLLYTGSKWHDNTASCQSSDGPPFSLLASADEYRYFGHREEFNKIFFTFSVPGQYGGLTWEYSLGAGMWATFSVNPIKLDETTDGASFTVEPDGTAGFTRNGTVVFALPSDWNTDAVNDVTGKYWIRVKAQKVIKPAVVDYLQMNPPYRGVAPGSSIIAVKLKDGREDHVLDGTAYVIRKARELGRPIVLVHSLGSSLGSHDGTEPLELALTDLAADGIPIVVAAGNSANLNLHVRGRLSSGQDVTVNWMVGNGRSQSLIDLWYSVSDTIGISVRTPSGTIVFGPTPDSGVVTRDGNVLILADERATGREWWIEVNAPAGTDLASTPWAFTLTGVRVNDGWWDAWTEPGEFTTNADSYALKYGIDPQRTIDYPGTAEGVITVGSYLSRSYWRSGCTACIEYSQAQGKRGIWWTPPLAPEVGAMAYSSSMGPTRDGRMKPEIVAPGANIISARAYTRQQKNSDPDNYHQVWRGTSFAAPHVAGVIALMLQVNPYLTPNEVRRILTENARLDRFTGEIDKQIGSPLCGWGKIWALPSTRNAHNMYSVRLEFPSIGSNEVVELVLDNQRLYTFALNESRVFILEFERDGNHTVSVTPIVQVGPAVRYVTTDTPWTFSSGGIRRFEYKAQYYLRVETPYGYATGTGWYYANSTVIVSVIPTEVAGYRFAGWSGSESSDSPTIQVIMNSSKNIVAEWRQANGSFGSENSGLAIIGILAALVTVLVVAKRFRIRTHPHRVGTSQRLLFLS